MAKILNPGLHPKLNLSHFSIAEIELIKKLGTVWYVTNSGKTISLGGTSFYKYILIKPTDLYKKMFNLNREIIVIFSRYTEFEPRTLDAFDMVYEQHQTLRLENICTVLVSRDTNVSDKLSNLLKSDPESRIIIPFNYDELITNIDPYFIVNRFRHKFYSRDLFAFHAPIKQELFFFGRNDFVLGIVNRHLSSENSGLFGLRKTGKTSVIFGIIRTLKKLKEATAYIDCQSPGFHKKRWNKALFYVAKEIKSQNHISISLNTEESYTEESAAERFEEDLLLLYKKNGKKSVLLIFDEIENITKDISPSEHWTNDMDFVLFWQTLRSTFQKFILRHNNRIFTFLIVGTNPRCIEMPTIHQSDNPIFNKIPYQYIKGFDVPQTKEMVKMLGGYMGLEFDEIVYSKLTEEFGGHPFLIRHVCSIMNKEVKGDRPLRIDKFIYEKSKSIFIAEYNSYIEMILKVLQDFYPSEFDMLTYLAIGDLESFKELENEFPELISHLLGYNIIDKNQGNFCFTIEAVKGYLVKKNKYKRIYNNDEDRWKEISERRNSLEKNLRTIVRRQLQATLGKNGATEALLAIMGNPRKSKYTGIDYSNLFNPNTVEIYFMDLVKIIRKQYSNFKNIFGSNMEDIIRKLEAINQLRSDAHAKNVEKDDMEYFRVCISSIESKIEDFL